MGNSVLSDMIANGPAMRIVSLPRGRQRLHTMPTSAGYETREGSGYDWDGRKRGQTPFTVLQHTLSGAGNLRYENRTFRIAPGQTMVLLVPHNHRYWLEPGGRWEFFWISMNGEEALRLHREILQAAGPVLTLQPGTIERIAGCTARLIGGEGERPGSASAIAYEAAMALSDDVFGSHPTTDEARAMQPALNHIHEHLDRPLPVDDLARAAGLSRAHFSRVFAASEGMPPAEYVQRLRLERATKLLANGAGLSVKQVSIASGFDDPNYFAKVFRRHYGASPTEFRTTGMYASAGRNLRPVDDIEN